MMMAQISIMHVSFAELCESVSINEELMLELIEHGIVAPIQGELREEWLFSASAVNVVSKATRIHRDLAIDWADIALVLNLLEEVETLRTENAMLKQRLSRFLAED
jgi:chaperone modulatory protein CbpM